jgi:hypothetical protein
MQSGQKYTRCFANTVGDHRALLQLEIERSADEFLRDLEQLLGKRYQLCRRQAATEILKPIGRHLGVSNRVHDIFVAHVVVKHSRIRDAEFQFHDPRYAHAKQFKRALRKGARQF